MPAATRLAGVGRLKEQRMAIDDLKDIYLAELRDLLSANEQARAATEKLARAAEDSELIAALRDGVKGIEDGIRELAGLIEGHGQRREGAHSKGMEGLVREAESHAIEEKFGAGAARDAMIITQYQRMTHYAIAGYGCVAAFAKRLGLEEEARALKTCLDDTRDGDRRMTEIAEGGINASAA
jgi:ferritin-like metal-binding protein YciE